MDMSSSCNVYVRSNNFVLFKKYILALAWKSNIPYLSESLKKFYCLRPLNQKITIFSIKLNLLDIKKYKS